MLSVLQLRAEFGREDASVCGALIWSRSQVCVPLQEQVHSQPLWAEFFLLVEQMITPVVLPRAHCFGCDSFTL